MAPASDVERVMQMWAGMRLPEQPTLEDWRREFSAMCARLPIPIDTEIQVVNADGVPALWVSRAEVSVQRTIMLLHSGGGVMGTAADYRDMAARLAGAAHARVLVVDYRLAPEHPHPAALDDAVTSYRWLLRTVRPQEIVLVGDSAGGGLAVSTLIALRGHKVPEPAAAAVISPLTDLAGEAPSLRSNRRRDRLVGRQLLLEFAAMFLGGADAKQTPLASPLYADLAGLPPLLVLVGEPEALLDDSRRLADKIRGVGGDVDLEIVDGMPHIWPLFSAILPEGAAALHRIGIFAARHAPPAYGT